MSRLDFWVAGVARLQCVKVRAWCLIEDRDNLSRRPVKNVETKRYQVDWFDNDQRLVRKITSRSFRESWTQIDPERANKIILEERCRIALVQNPKKFLADKQTRQVDETKQTTAEASVQGNIETANIQLNVSVPTQGAGTGGAGAGGAGAGGCRGRHRSDGRCFGVSLASCTARYAVRYIGFPFHLANASSAKNSGSPIRL